MPAERPCSERACWDVRCTAIRDGMRSFSHEPDAPGLALEEPALV